MKARYFSCELHTKPAASGRLHYCFDPPNNGQLIVNSIYIKGWAVHRNRTVKEVVCKSVEDEYSVSVKPEIFRPGVVERFKRHRKPETAGFEFTLTNPQPGDYQLKAHTADGREYSLGVARIKEYSHPKLLFMHIAKTAGTSVNSHFRKQYPEELCATHVESDRRWNTDTDYANRLEFVAGHISYYQFARKLDMSDYYKVTMVREPFSHLRSHLAWIRHLSEPAESGKLTNYPEHIKKLSQKLWETDFSVPAGLSVLVDSLHGQELHLLDNCQTRYFASPAQERWIDEEDFLVARKTLGQFDKIGLTEKTNEFLEAVSTKLQFGKPVARARRNVSKSHYGLDTTREEVREVLKPLVRYDLRLYKHVNGSQLNKT